MVVRRHKKGLVLTLDYACRSSTEKPMICHAGLSFKQQLMTVCGVSMLFSCDHVVQFSLPLYTTYCPSSQFVYVVASTLQ